MLEEGRKRDTAANALLALSFAANAAQSPKDFVRSGHVEGPGVQLMSTMMRKRGEAERNLDSGRVSHPARNKKKNNSVKEQKELLPMLLLMMMKKIKEKKKRAFLSHEEMELKTFKDFLEESYLIEAQRYFSSRSELEKHHGGIPDGYYANNAGSSDSPKWRLKPKSGGVAERTRRKERIASLSSAKEREAAFRKERAIKRKGYEAHHITPLHHSSKIKGSMSDAEWEERKKRDSKLGIYHGHHPRNLMAAKGPGTPSHKPGIHHRKGGAHELEGKVKDLVSGPGSKETAIGHRDLLAAAVRKQRREAKKNK